MKPFYWLLHLRPLLLVAIFPGLLLWLSHGHAPTSVRDWHVLGLLLALAGLPLLAVAHWQVYRPGQWGTQASPFDEPSRLETGGAYRWLRHPQLLGIYLLLLGEALWFGSLWLAGYALVVIVASARVAVRAEEARLDAAFGTAHAQWAARTRRFVPGLF